MQEEEREESRRVNLHLLQGGGIFFEFYMTLEKVDIKKRCRIWKWVVYFELINVNRGYHKQKWKAKENYLV